MSGEHRVALTHLIWGSNPPERTNKNTKMTSGIVVGIFIGWMIWGNKKK